MPFSGMTDNAQEPPPKIAKAMKAADVALLVTKFSLSHTKARKAACQAGARIASLPGINVGMIKRTLTGDYGQINKLSKRLAAILTKGKRVSITSPGGTKLTLNISGRKAIADDGNLTKKGSFGNLPAGEAFLAPQEGTTNGVLVVDGSLAEIKLDRPLTVTIKDGIITDLSGGKAVAKFRKAILAAGPKAKVVAELGIGTNPQAIVSPEVLEAEKVLGTCHIAFGNNVGFGGKNDAPFHSDGVVLNPTIKIDGQMIKLTDA
jgi:leucyl aminopeptidase (aminopeptidase T)